MGGKKVNSVCGASALPTARRSQASAGFAALRGECVEDSALPEVAR